MLNPEIWRGCSFQSYEISYSVAAKSVRFFQYYPFFLYLQITSRTVLILKYLTGLSIN